MMPWMHSWDRNLSHPLPSCEDTPWVCASCVVFVASPDHIITQSDESGTWSTVRPWRDSVVAVVKTSGSVVQFEGPNALTRDTSAVMLRWKVYGVLSVAKEEPCPMLGPLLLIHRSLIRSSSPATLQLRTQEHASRNIVQDQENRK